MDRTWSDLFELKAKDLYPAAIDPTHDFLHIKRVVQTALQLAKTENADRHVVLPAAYFHDMVNLPKNHPQRAQGSRLSAAAAIDYLASVGYPSQYFDAIFHAIEAHSFSAGITPRTLEAQIVQDADRLDALGAISIARCFGVSGLIKRPFYCDNEPKPVSRPLDDINYALDHFWVKLFKLPDMMQTASGRTELPLCKALSRKSVRKLINARRGGSAAQPAEGALRPTGLPAPHAHGRRCWA